jgi:nucleotide-binding universal stress UspA family protein
MKNVVVLIDYTEECKVALQQTRVIEELSGAQIHAMHVVSKDITPEEHAKLKKFAEDVLGERTDVETHLADGDLIDSLATALQVINPDLVVLCTHGIHGIVQRLFGARILKLVQSVDLPFLVVHGNAEIAEEGFSKILFPATPSPNAIKKIEQTASLAAEMDSEVVFYEIDRYLGDSADAIAANFEMAKKHFKERGIKWSQIKEQSHGASIGFAKQTLEFANDHGIEVIAMLSEVADHGMVMLKADKEAILTNDLGISVLACG